ncbi:hypothetical protein TNCV_3654471 [Trichonephila clavipes]|nr:hypothetical protein TNCV_3654471 [Trichonephila clavipes]
MAKEVNCPHCPEVQLSPNHTFNCSPILAKHHNVGLNPRPSTSSFENGHRYSKRRFERLRRHLISQHSLDKATALFL